jgi:hypothetical protein
MAFRRSGSRARDGKGCSRALALCQSEGMAVVLSERARGSKSETRRAVSTSPLDPGARGIVDTWKATSRSWSGRHFLEALNRSFRAPASSCRSTPFREGDDRRILALASRGSAAARRPPRISSWASRRSSPTAPGQAGGRVVKTWPDTSSEALRGLAGTLAVSRARA